jgi:ABC-type nitrate/sulfonate/bicarbonate transport system substrate-binding protein
LKRTTPAGFLSRRAQGELSALQASVRRQGAQRSAALRLLLVSRHATTVLAQREFWLEFLSVDQEYRAAIRRLAQFCQQHRDGSRRAWRSS